MKIKQGFYIKQHIESINNDNYLLVLEINDKTIKSINYGGTPTDSVILNYEDLIADGYKINVSSDKEVVCLTQYETYLKNGISASYPSDKKYTIPLKHSHTISMERYWSGSKWVDIPKGFYNEI